MADCDVLICGGPVGQLLALLLDDLGVSVIAFDKASEPYDLPRAAVVDDEVMRIFQAAGVDREVMRAAQVAPVVSLVDRRGRATEVFRFGDELGHPPLVSIHQPSFERVMVAALERRGVDLRWERRLDSLDRRGRDVSAWVRPRAAGPPPSCARYLVGCDGARSAVRARLGVAFGGSTFAQRWLVVDGTLDRPLARAAPHFVGDPARPAVCLPMSPGRHRWEWMIHPGEDAERFLAPGRIRELMEPWITDEQVEVERAVVYTFHARRAERWRAGRVLLAGDAAHTMPPFVGQGFSSGRATRNLAWKLDAVRGAPERLLDSYQVERCRHVTKMQNFAIRWGAAVQTRRPGLARLRDSAIGGLESTGVLDWLQSRASRAPDRGADVCEPFSPNRKVGALFPQPVIDGVRLDDRLGTGWGAVSASRSQCARAAGLTVLDGPDDAWLRRHSLDFALLRPDRYVFACGAAAEAGPRRPPPGWRAAKRSDCLARGGGGVIALLGATGTIGRHVAADLAERGDDVRAVVRDRASDVPLPVHGDLTRPQTLRAAFDGAERLLLLTPHGPDQDLHEAAAVEAAVAAGVQRIVKVSGEPLARAERSVADGGRPLAHRAADRGVGPALDVPAAELPDAEPAVAAADRRPASRADGPCAGRHGRRARRRRLCGRGPDGERRRRRLAPHGTRGGDVRRCRAASWGAALPSRGRSRRQPCAGAERRRSRSSTPSAWRHIWPRAPTAPRRTTSAG